MSGKVPARLFTHFCSVSWTQISAAVQVNLNDLQSLWPQGRMDHCQKIFWLTLMHFTFYLILKTQVSALKGRILSLLSTSWLQLCVCICLPDWMSIIIVLICPTHYSKLKSEQKTNRNSHQPLICRYAEIDLWWQTAEHQQVGSIVFNIFALK